MYIIVHNSNFFKTGVQASIRFSIKSILKIKCEK